MPSAEPYPAAERVDVVDEIHGHLVADPYRWLENPEAPETTAWSLAQDKRWQQLTADQSARQPLAERLMALIPGFIGAPVVIGDRRFWLSRTPGQDHAVLWVSDRSGSRALVDPNALSSEGTITLDGWSPSLEGERLAYQLSSGGDEESSLWVLDVNSGQVVEGPIDRVRYSPMSWMPGGDELFYVRRLDPGLVPADEQQYHRRVYRHRMGTDPVTDNEEFGEDSDMTAYFGVDVAPDGRWLVVTTSLGTAPRNDVHLRRLDVGVPPVPDRVPTGPDGLPAERGWIPVLVEVDAQAGPHLDRRGNLWLLTDMGAPRRRLSRLDLAAAAASADKVGGVGPWGPDQWVEVLAEDDDGAVLESFVLAEDHVVALWSRHAISEVTIHDRSSGSLVCGVELPGIGSADLTGRPDEGGEVWVGYTDYASPYRVLSLDPASGALAAAGNGSGPDSQPDFDSGPDSGAPPLKPDGGSVIVSHQVVATSEDGTPVRVTVVASTSNPDRPRPTVLYGYGGFGVSLTPAYSSSIRAWVEAGGVWAVAHLRGGSEEGERWHRDGMRSHKHHVFEDFEAASDLLVSEGWAARDQLGILGGSNGGLLVGAALTRSPQRYAAAVCSAPLLDMVRYELFGLGTTWNDEYGTADDPTEIQWLLDMSPYHHVVAAEYPAVLLTVFDSDSRVDPMHARKMAAALQWATTSDPELRPIVLRREADVGHGPRSVRRTVDLAADQLAFLGSQLGLAFPGPRSILPAG